MKAMILAAGLGTRLKPWTLKHPKALVPVKGVPMLERVMNALYEEGFDEIVINIHHFGEQIIDYLAEHGLSERIGVSDERERLLDTGGGILKASGLLFAKYEEPFLVHNVDILSNADLNGLMKEQRAWGNDITLLTSDRESSRKLIFDSEGRLKGWHNSGSGEFRPENFFPSAGDKERAFSGIYIIGKEGVERLRQYSQRIGSDAFPIMDFFLSECRDLKIREVFDNNLKLIDIGKPATLERANIGEL